MLEKSFAVSDFMTEQEISTLLEFYTTLPKTLNTGGDKKAWTTGFPIKSIPLRNFKSRVKKVFGKCNITLSMFLEEFKPWTVHSDWFNQDNKPYYACLIPLEFGEKVTHTVVFNELGVERNWREKLTTDKKYNYTKKELELLSHVDPDILGKISVDKFYKWKKGELIAWHRKLLHCSDNFLVGGLEQKTALVMFLNQDD